MQSSLGSVRVSFWIFRAIFLLTILVESTVPVFCDSKSIARKEIPVELQAADPEIKNLIEDATDKLESNDLEGALELGRKAWDLCNSKQLVSDIPIAGLELSSLSLLKGEIDVSRELLNKSLEAAAERSNVALEADILISLASIRELAGDRKGALETDTRALQKARAGKSLYLQARALGELGRMWLVASMLKDARGLLSEALDIDTANHYSLESLHQVYWAYSLLIESNSNLPTAINLLNKALILANTTGNSYGAFAAANALGAAYIAQGDVQRGVEVLNANSHGKSLLMDLSRLEMLAFAYQGGHLLDKSAESWALLLEKAKNVNNQYFIGEAAHKLGDIKRDNGHAEEAFGYYEIAAHSLRVVGNKIGLLQVLSSEIPLLDSVKQDERAPEIYAETLQLVREEKGKPSDDLQFALYLKWSFFYKQHQDWQKEIDNLDNAERLVHAPSTGTPDQSLVKTLMAMWVDHSLAADQLHLSYTSILAAEQAFQSALLLKDEKAQGILMSALLQGEQALGEYRNLHSACDSNRQRDCFEGALALYTLEMLNGEWRSKWATEQGFALSKLTALPEQLTAAADGDAYLARLLVFISPIASNVRIPIDMALARNFLFSRNDPSSARPVLEDSESLLTAAHLASNPLAEEGLKETLLNVHCWLALALAHTEPDEAEKKLTVCLEEAKAIGTKNAMNFAEAASASVRTLTNNPSAVEPTQYWIETLGDRPDLRRAYAFSLAAAKDFDGAIREMSLAASMYERAGQQADLAQVYRSLAGYYEMKNQPDYKGALSYLQKALLVARSLHDEKVEADVERDLGFAYEASGDSDDARKSFTTGRQMAERLNNWESAGRCSWGLAELSEKTQKDDAASLYSRSAAFFSKAKLSDQEAFVLAHEATILRSKGHYEEALGLLLHARDLAEQTTNNAAGAFVYQSLGYAYEAAGEYPNGILAFTAARDKASAGKNKTLESYSELAIARCLQMVGEWESAHLHAEAALRGFKDLNDETGEVVAYTSLMGVYTERSSELKDFQKASSIYKDAASLKTFHSNSLLPTLQLLEMYVQTKQYDELIAKATELISQCDSLKDNVCVAHLHMSLAEAHLGKAEVAAARKELQLSQPLVNEAHDFYSLGRFAYITARVERAAGNLDKAVQDYSQVIQMITTLQSASGLEEGSAISENYNFVFDDLISTLYQSSTEHPGSQIDYAALALRTVESNKAQSFDRVWGTRFSDAMRRRLPASVREKEAELQSTKARLLAERRDVLAAGSHPSRPAEQIRSELGETQRQMDTFVDSLRAKYPSYAMIRYPLPLELKDIPITEGEMLVECRVAEDASYVWFLSRGKGDDLKVSRFYSVPKGREWIRNQVQQIEKGISEAQVGGFDPKIVQDLTDALFPSSAYASLRQAKSIIYIPDDALALVPLEMLSPQATAGSYPLAGIPTTYYPSTEAMKISRAAKASEGSFDAEMFGIGDPITSQTDPRWEAATVASSAKGAAESDDGKVTIILRSAGISFERLPGTATEVRGIADLVEHNGGKANIRIGLEANRKEFLNTDLRGYRFLHFATHGLLPVDSGLKEPALLFSFNGDPGDMFLQLSQVLDLQLRSEMVVLSACNTGSGKLSKTEGVYNLGRAFLAAGSSSVVMSMWEVADNSTAVFMQELYRSIMKGDPKNVALMHARLALIRQGYDQPFFWAPFILMGE